MPGEAESQFLDCKAVPESDNDLQRHLARAISGFANATGGIVLWRVGARKAMPRFGRLKVEVRHLASCKVSSKWELYTRT